MKLLGALLVMFSAVSANAELINRSYCDLRAKTVEDEYKAMQDRFDVGEVTRTDVWGAELAVYDVQFDCRLIHMDDYCAATLDVGEKYLAGVTEEAQFGMKTSLDVQAAQLRLAKYTATCN